jgi:hypothetical protein
MHEVQIGGNWEKFVQIVQKSSILGEILNTFKEDGLSHTLPWGSRSEDAIARM